MADRCPCWMCLSHSGRAGDGGSSGLKPAQTQQVVRDAAAAGIRRVWLQQGAESAAAIRFCEENGISTVHGECILMFAEPAAFYHRAHRWVWKLLGKLPR